MQRSFVLPKDERIIVKYDIDNKPAVAVINTNLKDFDAKDVFAWSLTLDMYYDEIQEDGLPTDNEFNIIHDYMEELSKKIIGDSDHPNALFLAREFWDGSCRLLMQVYSPDPVDKVLSDIIKSESHPRPFEYKMEYDTEWKGGSWFLQDFK